MPALTVPAAEPVLRRAVAPLVGVQFRDASGTGDGSYTFQGYAAVVNQTTTLYSSRDWEWRERIAPGAFRDVLAAVEAGTTEYPVVLNREHQNLHSVASTAIPYNRAGGLKLSEDAHGLEVFARLDPEDPDVQAMAAKLRNGLANQMSFAFRIGEFSTEVTEDADGRVIETDTIHAVSHLYDVTVCAHGAYPQTEAMLRGLQAALRHAGIDPAGIPARHPQGGGHTTPVMPEAGQDAMDRTRRLAAMRAKTRAAVATLKHAR